MVTFLTSMRPKRSMRIGSLPVTTVSPTAPNSGPRPLLSHGRVSASTTRLRTLAPSRLLVETSLKASRSAFCDSNRARQVDEERIGAQPGEDAQRRRRARRPRRRRGSGSARPTASPASRPARGAAPSPSGWGASKWQVNISSWSSPAKGKAVAAPLPAMVTGRSRKRRSIASEKAASGLARGCTFSTRTRWPGRSGLGNA